jgi:uncharacterized protein (TIGR03000 family)
MRSFPLAFVSPAVLAAGFLFGMAGATQAQPASWGWGRSPIDRPVSETYSSIVGHSAPIFLTSINYPGLYGAYTHGVPALAYNTRISAPTFHGALEPVYILPGSGPAVPEEPAAAAEPARQTALVNVLLPSEANLWIQDVKMTQPGSVREFVSPPLAPGQDYTYTVAASWTENGREVNRKRVVHVAPGDKVSVDLMTAEPRPEGATTLRPRPLP